ncbi:MAG: hypothetical protein ACHRHE_00380 [Tepidisphaerales bacterium]
MDAESGLATGKATRGRMSKSMADGRAAAVGLCAAGGGAARRRRERRAPLYIPGVLRVFDKSAQRAIGVSAGWEGGCGFEKNFGIFSLDWEWAMVGSPTHAAGRPFGVSGWKQTNRCRLFSPENRRKEAQETQE